MNSFLREEQINELIICASKQKDLESINSNKVFLKIKRKRSPLKDNSFISSKNSKKKKIGNEETDENIKFKFQNFSKNIFSIILAYLKIDDILKLKDVGSSNIHFVIRELLLNLKNK